MDKATALWVIFQIAITMIFYRLGGIVYALTGLIGCAIFYIFIK